MPAAWASPIRGDDPDANHHDIGVEQSAVVESHGALGHLVNLSADVPIDPVVAVGGGDQLGKLRAENPRHRLLLGGDHVYLMAAVT